MSRGTDRFEIERQLSFFNQDKPRFAPWPEIRRTPEGFRKTLQEARAIGHVGLDLEFQGTHISIIGVASHKSCAACFYDPQLANETLDLGVQLICHSGIESDWPLIQLATGRKVPLEKLEDSMFLHYLLGGDFCALPGKTEDDDEPGAIGLMNLWAMANLRMAVPNWKQCRGLGCLGPCPKHDPLGYCAMDSYAGLVGFLEMKNEAERMRLPWKLYRERMALGYVCSLMRQKGVYVDQLFIEQLNGEFEEKKQALFPSYIGKGGKRVFTDPNPKQQDFIEKPRLSPFNPNSPDQVLEYFSRGGIRLDQTQRSDIEKALIQTCKRTGTEYEKSKGVLLFSVDEDTPGILCDLINLYQYKFSGKGLKAWFDPEKIDKDSLIHPRFIATGTGTKRLASNGPNFQNIPARGWGALVRRVIRARQSDYDILKSDKRQLELRMVLYDAGGPQPADDAFNWLVENAPEFGVFPKPRDIAKSVSHAGDYLEGLKLIEPFELETRSVKMQINAGALKVFPDWEYKGCIVAFTGANLAERLFGDRSYENRKKALEIQEVYFKRFHWIRDWHQKVSAEIEDRGYVRSASGSFLYLHGTPEEQMKVACAAKGQGQSAEHMEDIMLRYHRELGEEWTLQVHDEAVVEKPHSWSDKQCHEYMNLMAEETWRFPGFKCPVKTSRGPNWGQCEEI